MGFTGEDVESGLTGPPTTLKERVRGMHIRGSVCAAALAENVDEPGEGYH